MEDATASRTALGISLVRATHARIDPDPVFADDWGDRLVPEWARDEFRQMVLARMSPAERDRAMAAPATMLDDFFARQDMYGNAIMRARWSEDALADAVAEGVRQYVIVGAGFDSFALRRPAFARGVEIFEIDHPATQSLKLDQLRAAGVADPPGVHFIAADLAHESIGAALARSPFDQRARVFFSWLGVTSYLTREANIASLIAFSYLDQAIFAARVPADVPESETLRHLATMVAHFGEPWVSGFDPALLASELAELGLNLIEDLNGPDLAERYGRVGARSLPTAAVSHFALARAKGLKW
jgi:methyltransferase (TIGR00027 family)